MMQLFSSFGMFRAFALNADETSALPALRHQHNLANIFSRLQIAMRFAYLVERKRAIHMGLNPALLDASHNLERPARNFLAFAPHMTEVQAEHAFVATHQSQRMKLRSL